MILGLAGEKYTFPLTCLSKAGKKDRRKKKNTKKKTQNLDLGFKLLTSKFPE